MAKVSRIRFLTHFYEAGLVKYAKGEHYPKNPETTAQMLQGHAEELEVDTETGTITPGVVPPKGSLTGTGSQPKK